MSFVQHSELDLAFGGNQRSTLPSFKIPLFVCSFVVCTGVHLHRKDMIHHDGGRFVTAWSPSPTLLWHVLVMPALRETPRGQGMWIGKVRIIQEKRYTIHTTSSPNATVSVNHQLSVDRSGSAHRPCCAACITPDLSVSLSHIIARKIISEVRDAGHAAHCRAIAQRSAILSHLI